MSYVTHLIFWPAIGLTLLGVLAWLAARVVAYERGRR